MLFNLGVGLVLSAMYVFFRDVQYLWSVFVQLLMYGSAIFYSIEGHSPAMQAVFHVNPVFLFIQYFRTVVIHGAVPPLWLHGLILFDALLVLTIGCAIYKKYNHQFLYYV